MKSGGWLKSFLCFALVGCAFLFAAQARSALPVTIDDIVKVIPRAKSHTHKLQPVDHYLVKDGKGDVVGIAFVTSSVPPGVRAYVDEVDILVGMDVKGRVTGINILSHKETPDYIDKVTSSGFLDKFKGRSVERGFDDIDAVTGATVSSNAMKRDIQTAAFEITKKLIDSGLVRKEMGSKPGPFELIPLLVVLVLIVATFSAVMMPKRRWLRYAVWISSVAVIGFWLNVPITIGNFVDLRAGVFPSYLPLIILFVFAVLASLMKGNLYCFYMCPFGILQEGACRLKLPKCQPSNEVQRNASWLRWVILIAVVFAIANAVSAFRTVEPFALCFSRTVNVIVLVQALVILVAALFLRRPWCRYFCPTGAILDLLNLLGRKIEQVIWGHEGTHVKK